MRTTIVIPAYNTGEYLRQTVAGVTRQSDPNWALKLVDDGSTDDTLARATELAAGDARIEVLHKANGGMAEARNYGVAHADPESDAVLLLDHDDLLDPNALAVLRHALQSVPDAPAVHGLAGYIDSAGSDIARPMLDEVQMERFTVERGRLHPRGTAEPATFEMLAYRNCIVTMGQVLIRTDALSAAGPFDPNAVPSDDYDMYLRLSKMAPIPRVSRRVVLWRDHASNTSGNRDALAMSEDRVRRKAFGAFALGTSERRTIEAAWKAASRTTARRRLGWASDAARSGAPLIAARELARAARDYHRSYTTRWMSRDDQPWP